MNIRNYQKKLHKDGKFKELSPEILAYLDAQLGKAGSKPKEDKTLKPVKEEIDIFKDAE